MELERISVKEAKKRLDDGDHVLIDVRSLPEFRAEHAAGAYNIPFLHKTPQGMIPNQDFLSVVQATFPNRDQPIVTTCAMGGRSSRAAMELISQGYTRVVDLQGGFSGEVDDDGQLVNPGWKTAGFPTEQGEPADRAYGHLSAGLSSNATPPPAEAPPPQEGPPLDSNAPGMNRFASQTRRVQCSRLGKELPGLKRRPYPGELGERIFDTISAEAWDGWVEHSKMIINEYRIHAADPEALKLLMEQCEQFLFGGGVVAPEGYVPE